MELFPAIDLKDNKVVRLSQGDYDKVKIYSENVAEMAEEFLEKGAKNLHIVDLDGAKEGKPLNQEAISKILKVKGLFFEIGGGIRDEKRIADYLELGINRVILGTIATKNPDFVGEMVKKYGDAIAVGVDAKNEMVATHGWLENSGIPSFEFCQKMVDLGVSTIIYTDISKDGMLSGCDLPSYQRLCGISGLKVIASGGVSSLDELVKLKSMGCHGAIVGKAIYEGKISLTEALAL
ncbi:MAG: 1-(5-phosphoribosyl)-5-[(5-phosphoribosylamino)methylideneamino]imidazole-4-carboxamide isomerase [Eubacteriales bacterium]